ncbi:hypothetical protein Y032_0154g3004 [Ancylostoma ceylanicum]|nr:hypothetical protein Y032_0154g3004 [Ancylostoma ceylanicum]
MATCKKVEISYRAQDSEISDPIYIRESSASSEFAPLPRVESEAAAAVKPDDFALYYKYDSSGEVRASIPLYLVHRNTKNEIFHFPVLRISEDNGSKWWHVQIGNNKMQSFRQLSDLVRCYHLYRFTDARSGRMEVFPLWKGGIVDDFE